MVYDEDDFLLLSGIQHFVFCKRQWALIHIEQQWDENELTIEGQNLHKKADEPFIREKRKEKLIIRGMPVKSYSLGTSGICDVVEFIQNEKGVSIHESEIQSSESDRSSCGAGFGAYGLSGTSPSRTSASSRSTSRCIQ